MSSLSLLDLVSAQLVENKGVDIKQIDVREMTSVTDYLFICTANSSRHAKSIADKLSEACKKANFPPLSIEGKSEAEWILVDLGDIVIHIMLAEMREHYNLEKLWAVIESKRQINE